MTRRGAKAASNGPSDSPSDATLDAVAGVAPEVTSESPPEAAHGAPPGAPPVAAEANEADETRPGVELIDDAEAAAEDAAAPGDVPGGDARLTPDLSVGRSVIVEVARLAALEIPDVLRVARRGPPWRAALAGPAIMVRVRPEGVTVKLRIIARPGADLVTATAHVQDAVGRAVERLLGLHVREVTVLVDGVGG